MHGYIAPNGPFCGTQQPGIANSELQITGDDLRFTNGGSLAWFRVYPNPTDAKITVEYTGEAQPGKITVEIYGMKGDRILTKELLDERRHEFSLEGRPTGIYLVRIVTEGMTETKRILKR